MTKQNMEHVMSDVGNDLVELASLRKMSSEMLEETCKQHEQLAFTR